MIKGKYVATVEVDFKIDENAPHLKPFDEIRDDVRYNLTPSIQGVLQEEFEGFGKVVVTQHYADMYKQVRGNDERNKNID